MKIDLVTFLVKSINLVVGPLGRATVDSLLLLSLLHQEVTKVRLLTMPRLCVRS
jgi:hypothetical protein